MPEEARSSAYWLAKAEEARTVGDGMQDPVAAAIMVRLAEWYGHMARHAAAREERRSSA